MPGIESRAFSYSATDGPSEYRAGARIWTMTSWGMPPRKPSSPLLWPASLPEGNLGGKVWLDEVSLQ